jgi:hypothetical protein
MTVDRSLARLIGLVRGTQCHAIRKSENSHVCQMEHNELHILFTMASLALLFCFDEN